MDSSENTTKELRKVPFSSVSTAISERHFETDIDGALIVV